jgi:arylsulfatase A-like enzyme
MRRIHLPIVALIWTSLTAVLAGQSEAKKPNVLIILADDFGYGIANCYGGDPGRVATPNIDRLATEGARFTDGYVTSSVCGPSRAGLMTGRYQQRFGIYANTDNQVAGGGVPGDQTMMPRYFKDAGYVTAMIGKWHLGDKKPGQHPLEKGYDEYFGFNSAQTDYFKSPILFHNRKKVASHDYLSRELSSQAARVIAESKDKPFFIYLAYNAVHGPNHAPAETIERFSKLPKNEAIQAAMVSELDAGIGRVLGALDATGKSADTLVFFLSDNGGLPNWWDTSHGGLRGFKREQFDGGQKVPFVVRWPAQVKAGQVRSQPVISLDILPTALEAARISKPANQILDGISLLPSLSAGQDLQPERLLFWAGSHCGNDRSAKKKADPEHDNPPPSWAVRRGPWKMMQILEEGAPTLFHVGEDPGEAKNVIAQHPDIAAQLQAAFVEWFKMGGEPINWKKKYYQQLKDLMGPQPGRH